MFKLNISKADRLFSDVIRFRDGWKCVRCGRQHEVKQGTLDSSHYWSRSMKSTRFDMENADSLCKLPCHTGTDPNNLGWEYQRQIKNMKNEFNGEYTNFKIKQLGQNRFDELMVRAHTPQRVDEKLIAMGLKMELKKMGVKCA